MLLLAVHELSTRDIVTDYLSHPVLIHNNEAPARFEYSDDDYCTVSVKVVVFMSVPPETVTVTVDVPVGVEIEEGELLLPQPLTMLRPKTPNMTRSSVCKGRRFLKLRKHSAAARVAPGKSGLELRRRSAVALVVETVSVVVRAVVPDAMMGDGEKLQVAPAGKPEQANETAPAYPYDGVTEMVTVPLCPSGMVSDPGVTPTEKFCGAMV